MEKSNMENRLPIDWSLGEKLAGNNRAVAEEMIRRLMAILPDDVNNIRNAYESKDNADLALRLHKLHGATCYCGTPRLKEVLAEFEYSVKHEETNAIPVLFERFEEEIRLLFEAVKQNKS